MLQGGGSKFDGNLICSSESLTSFKTFLTTCGRPLTVTFEAPGVDASDTWQVPLVPPGAAASSVDTYSHTWEGTGKLGIVLQQIGREKSDLEGVWVTRVTNPELVSTIQDNSKLVQVAGQQVGSMSYDQVLSIVKQASRPLTIVFQVPLAEEEVHVLEPIKQTMCGGNTVTAPALKECPAPALKECPSPALKECPAPALKECPAPGGPPKRQAKDGGEYTRDEFTEYYGDDAQWYWDQSAPVPAAAAASHTSAAPATANSSGGMFGGALANAAVSPFGGSASGAVSPVGTPLDTARYSKHVLDKIQKKEYLAAVTVLKGLPAGAICCVVLGAQLRCCVRSCCRGLWHSSRAGTRFTHGL